MSRAGKPVIAKYAKLPAGARPNTLGLGERELGDLLDLLQAPEQSVASPKRDFCRWPFRATSVRVGVFHPGGVTSWITVACRNISRAGMAILHSAYIHTGAKVRVMLPNPVGGEVQMDGWVTRCIHRSGVVHEIGIRFSQHLDVQSILRPNRFTDWFSLERVKPDDLAGNIVYVDDSEIDRKIVKHYLRETRLNCTLAPSGAEGLRCIDETTDLVLVDYQLGDMTGAQFVAEIRGAHLKVPVIILTCDPQSTAGAAGCDAGAFLAKPVSQDLLMRAIAEFLIVRRPQGLAARAADSTASPALTEDVIAAISQLSRRLEDCVQRQEAVMARTVCLQIASAAGMVGFQDVNQLARKVADALARSMSTAESISPLRTLISLCQKARPKPSPVPKTGS